MDESGTGCRLELLCGLVSEIEEVDELGCGLLRLCGDLLDVLLLSPLDLDLVLPELVLVLDLVLFGGDKLLFVIDIVFE